MLPIHIPLLEVITITKCNLNCIGCFSFSDYDIREELDWTDIKASLAKCLTRVSPGSISLFGGEPTMLSNLPDIIRDVRAMAPDAMIQVITNGTYIRKRLDILEALHEVGHSLLTFSMHEPEKSYTNKVKDFLLSQFKWATAAHDSTVLETSNKFYLDFRTDIMFSKTFQGDYINAHPFDSNPDEAFKICPFHNSFQLYNGQLYKCNPLALLPKMLSDWGLENNTEWQPYLNYMPLSLDSTDKELVQFVNTMNNSVPQCRMCPSATSLDGIRKKRGQRKKKIIPIKPKLNELY
jgi:organic radical activating enzyme